MYKFQCGFRKGYKTQHSLLVMLEIRKGATDNNKASDYLSKAFWILDILGTLLFNVLMWHVPDIKYTTYLTGFADDNTCG